MFIGFTFSSLDLCITIAALYSTSTMLFGGFYSNTIPLWLNWLRYGSIVYYGYINMQMVEFGTGPPISCAIKNSRYPSCISTGVQQSQQHSEHLLNNSSSSSNSIHGQHSLGAPSIGDRLSTMIHTSSHSTRQLFIPESEILIGLDSTNPYDLPNPIWFNTLCLIGFLVVFRLLGYIVLRIYHKPA